MSVLADLVWYVALLVACWYAGRASVRRSSSAIDARVSRLNASIARELGVEPVDCTACGKPAGVAEIGYRERDDETHKLTGRVLCGPCIRAGKR